MERKRQRFENPVKEELYVQGEVLDTGCVDLVTVSLDRLPGVLRLGAKQLVGMSEPAATSNEWSARDEVSVS